MSSIAEFYSQNLAAEVTKGMDQKVKNGGYPGRAPVGYRNARELVDGVEIKTIVPHEEQAEHVRWAFEAYATGDYSIRSLTDALEARGLRTRLARKDLPKPMVRSKVHYMLRSSFYVGVIEWKGEQYQGRHQPLVSIETWTQVQKLLSERDHSAERQRTHKHYLKGSLYCGRCDRRMSVMSVTGRGGQYEYFYCLGRHRGEGCDLPFLAVDKVEEAVAELYRDIELGPEIADEVRTILLDEMQRATEGARAEHQAQQQRVVRLEQERRRLVRAHLDGAIPVDLLREEQERLRVELLQAEAQLRAAEVRWDDVERNVTYALGMTADCYQAYRRGEVGHGGASTRASSSHPRRRRRGVLQPAHPRVLADAARDDLSRRGTQKPRPIAHGSGFE